MTVEVIKMHFLVLPFFLAFISGVAISQDFEKVLRQSGDGILMIQTFDRSGELSALGSGVVVREDGIVVTNYHVIDAAFHATAKLTSGETYPVQGVVNMDKQLDLAVIKLDVDHLHAVTLGNSDSVHIGEWVLAVGNPRGLEHTVSTGIISAIRVGEFYPGTILQTTAPISHGSSGGALLNMRGELVGITTFIIQGENLNFAAAVNHVKPLLGDSIRVSLEEYAEQNYHHSSEYLMIAAHCALRTMKPVEAIPYFKNVIDVDEENVRAHIELGIIYDSLGQKENARPHFITAVRSDPDSAEAHFHLGRFYMKTGKKKEALEEYTILKSLDIERARQLFAIVYPEKPVRKRR